MSGGFTPGPWEAHRYPTMYYRGPEEAGDPVAITLKNDGLILAIVNPDCFPNVETNARLIAAAPELYEALEGLVRYADAVAMSAGMGKNQRARLEAAKTILAKARGNQ